MNQFSLEHLDDDSLLDGLHNLASRERSSTADLLAHIGEVARRRLHGHLGFSSMQAYCCRVLHLSEDAAKKRVQVARKGWVLPVIFEAIADGRVHLSGMTLLVPFTDEQNVHELIEAATHRSKVEIELILAERFPKPVPEEAVDEIPRGAPGHLGRSSVRPIAPGQYLVQYTIDEASLERQQYALQLLSHRNPKGWLSFLSSVANEVLIAQLENEKLGATDDPRDCEPSLNGRYIPRSVRRAVLERDGWRCGYVSPDGRRCESRWMLEFDHIHPFACGGESTAENVRLLCRPHNQLMADRAYGEEFMERKRTSAEVPGKTVREHPPAAYGALENRRATMEQAA